MTLNQTFTRLALSATCRGGYSRKSVKAFRAVMHALEQGNFFKAKAAASRCPSVQALWNKAVAMQGQQQALLTADMAAAVEVPA
jgi:hypothetical protein